MKKKILVIEDDPSQKYLIEILFKYASKNSYELFYENNLEDSMNKLNTETFDLIISDLRLPKSKSLSYTIENVINNKKNSAVIFCSVEDIQNNILKMIEDNGCQFVSKNFDFLNELIQQIDKSLGVN